MRWRCVDLKRVIKQRFDIELYEVSIGRLLKTQGFSHISARPQHPTLKADAIETLQKTSPSTWIRR